VSLVNLLTNGTPKSPTVDKVLAVFDVLHDAERDALHALIQDPIWSGPQIASALREMGFNITGDQIKRFRQKLKEGKVQL
jgi:hypothetical protein